MRVIAAIVVFGLLCLAALAGLAFMRSGRAEAETGPPVMQEGALTVHGVPRTFTICLPRSAKPDRHYPIVVMLHGGLGAGNLLAMQTGVCDYVDREQFIAVLPNANGPQWNDGRAATAWAGDDVAFLNALVDHVATAYGGDRSRAFVAGPSNGGMMALRMACESTATFRAYVAVVANLPEELWGRCRPSRPVPILFVLSKDDPGMPWGGGELGGGHLLGPGARQFAAGGRVMSGPDTVGFFAEVNGCSGESVTMLPDRAHDGTSVRLHTYRCGRSPVVLYEILGGGHGWPGSRIERGPRLTQLFGVVSQDIDATAVMIDFFKRNGL